MHSEFDSFDARKAQLKADYRALLARRNEPVKPGNGVFARWRDPVLTRSHAPLHWRYDLDEARNPYLLERLGINAAFNAGAIKLGGEYHLVGVLEPSGDLARLEVPIAELPRLATDPLRTQLTKRLEEIGFHFVTLDLQGLRSGSLNVLVPVEELQRSAEPS